jgi:hypothetical protein
VLAVLRVLVLRVPQGLSVAAGDPTNNA